MEQLAISASKPYNESRTDFEKSWVFVSIHLPWCRGGGVVIQEGRGAALTLPSAPQLPLLLGIRASLRGSTSDCVLSPPTSPPQVRSPTSVSCATSLAAT